MTLSARLRIKRDQMAARKSPSSISDAIMKAFLNLPTALVYSIIHPSGSSRAAGVPTRAADKNNINRRNQNEKTIFSLALTLVTALTLVSTSSAVLVNGYMVSIPPFIFLFLFLSLPQFLH
jgi:hypothetical protein